MIDVVRKTCIAGEHTKFQFSTPSISYRIKNFTSAPIFVCFGSKWDDAQTVMIGSGTAEKSTSNSPYDTTSSVIVMTETSGIVEVIQND